jgi:CheY-like chemotaxis protein
MHPAPTILVLEDNPQDVHLLREAFRECALDVRLVVAENAVQAYHYLNHRPPYAQLPDPDLVIIDLNLPIIRGDQVLTEIKQGRWADVPVVMLSSSQRQTEIQACLARGAAEYLVKPPVFDEYLDLVPRLRRYLDRFDGETTPPPSDPPAPPTPGLVDGWMRLLEALALRPRSAWRLAAASRLARTAIPYFAARTGICR